MGVRRYNEGGPIYAFSRLLVDASMTQVRLVSSRPFQHQQEAAQHRHYVLTRWEKLWQQHREHLLSINSDHAMARLFAHAMAEAEAWGLPINHPWVTIRTSELRSRMAREKEAATAKVEKGKPKKKKKKKKKRPSQASYSEGDLHRPMKKRSRAEPAIVRARGRGGAA